MTSLVKYLIIILMTLFFTSCGFDMGNFGSGVKGNGEIVTDTRNTNENFSEIHVQEGINVYVTQSPEFTIKVEGDENIIELIGTDISHGELKIHAIENIGRATKNVYVSLPDITALKSSSGANLYSEGDIKAKDLELDASSGANITVSIFATDVEVDATSGANINLSGEANKAELDVSSGANIKGEDLQTEFCEADASSGGNIRIRVSKDLDANASSGGNISYKGAPNVKKNKMVSGSINSF